MFNQKELLCSIEKTGSAEILLMGTMVLRITKGVFVPDSSTLDFINVVDIYLREHSEVKKVVEIGVGSGIVLIPLARGFSNIAFYGCDISSKALNVTDSNAKKNNLRNISLYKNDPNTWIAKEIPENIDLVIANPPYVGDNELHSQEFISEYPDYLKQPKRAIRTYDATGLHPFLKIVEEAKKLHIKIVFFRCNPKTIVFLQRKLEERFIMSKVVKTALSKNEYLLVYINEKRT